MEKYPGSIRPEVLKKIESLPTSVLRESYSSLIRNQNIPLEIQEFIEDIHQPIPEDLSGTKLAKHKVSRASLVHLRILYTEIISRPDFDATSAISKEK